MWRPVGQYRRAKAGLADFARVDEDWHSHCESTSPKATTLRSIFGYAFDQREFFFRHVHAVDKAIQDALADGAPRVGTILQEVGEEVGFKQFVVKPDAVIAAHREDVHIAQRGFNIVGRHRAAVGIPEFLQR